MSDPRSREANCAHCGHAFAYRQYHAGFSNEGYMYCDQDEAVLTWGAYNSSHTRIVDKHPWMLSPEERRLVEASIKPCPCGGRFAFSNQPRCPSCNRELPELLSNPIYFAVVGRRVDGDKADAWVEA